MSFNIWLNNSAEIIVGKIVSDEVAENIAYGLNDKNIFVCVNHIMLFFHSESMIATSTQPSETFGDEKETSILIDHTIHWKAT